MSFTNWYNEVADMPSHQQDGAWVDLETGFTYADWANDNCKTTQNRWKANDTIQTARNIAKMFGGKALKGTGKQKAWAETIRENIIKNTNEIQSEILCTVSYFSHSKFWIENRELTVLEFGARAEKFMSLLAEHNNLSRKANATIKTEKCSNVIVNMPEVNLILDQCKKVITEMNKLFKLGDALC